MGSPWDSFGDFTTKKVIEVHFCIFSFSGSSVEVHCLCGNWKGHPSEGVTTCKNGLVTNRHTGVGSPMPGCWAW